MTTFQHTPIPDWHKRLRAATSPLPGLTPYTLERPLRVEGRYEGWQLLDFLDDRHPHVGRHLWAKALHEQRLSIDGRPVCAPEHVVRGGNQLLHRVEGVTEPEVSVDIELLYHDAVMLAVSKPAPLPVHACGRFYRHTLQAFLAQMFPDWRLRPVHRLDADTTGLMLFAKTREAARALSQQFETQQAQKTYLAKVCGLTPLERTSLDQAIGRKVTRAGGRALAADGDIAATEVETLAHFDDASLVQVLPKTGRTNQIRIHLAAWGHPIVDDPLYRPGVENVPKKSVLSRGPISLHAWRLQIAHPGDGRLLDLEAKMGCSGFSR